MFTLFKKEAELYNIWMHIRTEHTTKIFWGGLTKQRGKTEDVGGTILQATKGGTPVYKLGGIYQVLRRMFQT
jgi:hypothetical protein